MHSTTTEAQHILSESEKFPQQLEREEIGKLETLQLITDTNHLPLFENTQGWPCKVCCTISAGDDEITSLEDIPT